MARGVHYGTGMNTETTVKTDSETGKRVRVIEGPYRHSLATVIYYDGYGCYLLDVDGMPGSPLMIPVSRTEHVR